jgi:hypothetical protein
MDFLGQVNHLGAVIELADGVAYAVVPGAGRIRLVDATGMASGDEIVLGFRSESVSLCSDGADLTGVILAATYIGGYMEYLVDVEGTGLHVRAPADSDLELGASAGLRLTTGGIRAWHPSSTGHNPPAPIS